jgi:hypothetical protein
MQNEFDFIQEEIKNHTKRIEYYNKCLKEENEKIQNLQNRKNSLCTYEVGKLCYFFDGYSVDNKPIRPFIRPFHHSEIGPRGEKYYSADWEGNVIGHGWKYCKLVSIADLVGRIISH